MLILHTSDWHLGRTFHGVDILDVQARAMAEIVDWVREREVALVLVAGDVYDRAQPRTEVVELLNDTLAQLRAAGAQVVVTSGNHDSPARLGFGAQIMSHGGVHMLTAASGAARPVVFTESAAGSVSSAASQGPFSAACTDEQATRVAVYGIPYLEPRAAAPLLGCAPTHQAVLAAVMSQIDADRRARGRITSIVMAHAFVTGAHATDSERIVDSGGLGTVSADIFARHDYTALGHIHRRQRITDTVRYSGSPVAYSFSEAGHPKGAWLLEVGEHGVRKVEQLEHTAGLELVRLAGRLDDLLAAPEHAAAETAWCQVVLTDPERPAAAMERIRGRFPRTVELRWEPEGGRTLTPRAYALRVAEASSPEDLCDRFYEHVRHRALSPEERADVTDAVATVRSREVAR